MNKTLSNFILALIIGIVLVNCANRGRPSGGEKDTTPPVITSASPKNYATNFKSKEIRINFNEYIKINNLQKQLIISPPMKTQPQITPLGGASKYITIKIFDTLQPNTTYAFNFGNSIEDNNEGNPYPYFRYVFSTGKTIDSLSVKGQINDALSREPDTFVSVMLYEADATYTDSIVYKKTPKYITNTLDSVTTFSIDNVKAGKYKLLAIKDANSDNKYQSKSDKIAFYKDFITVPNNDTYKLKLFKEAEAFKVIKPRQNAANKIDFPFIGDYSNVKINLKSKTPANFKSRITKDKETDSLYFWYTPKDLEIDSLIFKVSNKNYDNNFTVPLKDKKRDTLIIKTTSFGTIGSKELFKIHGSTPFKSFNTNKITVINTDSVKVKFKTKFDTINNTLALDFKKLESSTYQIKMLPEAITDFFGDKNDTLNYTVQTVPKSNFGNLRIKVNNATYPIIVQLTNAKGEIKYELISAKKEALDFLDISPGKYYIRVIFDTNKNNKYDSGNYLKGVQPERVSHFEISESIRADWSYEETLTLLKK